MLPNEKMITIGMTGGVGAGKSTVLGYLQEHCRCRIFLTDRMAAALQAPGGPLYVPVLDLLREAAGELKAADPAAYQKLCQEHPGQEGLAFTGEGGVIDRSLMAALIFRSEDLLERVNGVIHPAVIRAVHEEIDKARHSEDRPEFLVVESALLIESGLADIFDSVWYIYCLEEIRRKRLRLYRGYTDSRIDAIMRSQLPDSAFRERCDVVIDNSGDTARTWEQTEAALTALRERLR